MMKIDNISIGIPCYNEEKNIKNSIKNCLNFIKINKIINYEILIVDNKSTDNTVKIVNLFSSNKKIKLIKNKKNIFYAGSVNKIINQSIYQNIGIIDSDGQYSFYDFKKLFSILILKNYDVIFGFRNNRKDSYLRILVSVIFNFLSKLIISSNLKDLNCGIKVLKKRNCFKKFNYKINHVNPEIYCISKKNKLKIGELKVAHFYRDEGQSIHSFLSLFKTFFEVLIYFIRLKKRYLVASN